MLYPALLIPLLVWIGARYLPVIHGAGILRVALTMVLVGGLLAAQMLGLHRSSYPLTTWTMYSSPNPSNVIWDLRIVEGNQTLHYPWTHLAPVQEVRGIHFAVAARGEQVFEESSPDQREEAEARLAGILLHLGSLYARRSPTGSPTTAPSTLELRRCDVDFRDLRPRDQTDCPVLFSVPIETSDGS
ncbi:MAG: hypothetical protein EA421_00340 [Gemmatimonadales bacterium]|nr:MAG: hypothetical protein EA421_00340 [Gemmatimonadales bacterium]